jgi:hypothetical protein
VTVWACWKQSRSETLRPWERRVTLAYLSVLGLVLGLAMAADDWGRSDASGGVGAGVRGGTVGRDWPPRLVFLAPFVGIGLLLRSK